MKSLALFQNRREGGEERGYFFFFPRAHIMKLIGCVDGGGATIELETKGVLIIIFSSDNLIFSVIFRLS